VVVLTWREDRTSALPGDAWRRLFLEPVDGKQAGHIGVGCGPFHHHRLLLFDVLKGTQGRCDDRRVIFGGDDLLEKMAGVLAGVVLKGIDGGRATLFGRNFLVAGGRIEQRRLGLRIVDRGNRVEEIAALTGGGRFEFL